MRRNEPLRLFEGTHAPHERFWAIKKADGPEPEVELYGYISEYSWFEDEITPRMFKDDIEAAGKGGPITVRINSGGGDVFAASAMRSILVDYPGKVTVRIDGLAASAATIVATAGAVVRMQDTAYWMIHDPIGLAWGDVEEVKRTLETLKTVKDGILDAYEQRTGKKLTRERLAKMMTDETWFTANEAKEVGFVDEVIGEKTPAISNVVYRAGIYNALRDYRNVPEGLLDLMRPQSNEETEPSTAVGAIGSDDEEATERRQSQTRLRAEAKILRRSEE